jgi:hypothetical protein
MIESYEFGRIVVDGKIYTSDIIIGDRISSWWRREGHEVCREDIEKIGAEILVIGTGASGLVRILPDAEEFARKRGMKIIAEPTRKACETYNRLSTSGKKVAAALHLTC